MNQTKHNNNESQGANLLSRIIVAVAIVLASIGLHSIAWDIWQGEVISSLERLLATICIFVIVATIGFVIVQRIQMRKTEEFRREKW